MLAKYQKTQNTDTRKFRDCRRQNESKDRACAQDRKQFVIVFYHSEKHDAPAMMVSRTACADFYFCPIQAPANQL